ncbi:MAG: hypothetical protein J6R85_06565, partial [Lentisphaeria bacterium]|nr:hypothetical protein [Lentisphaeria bacterium]
IFDPATRKATVGKSIPVGSGRSRFVYAEKDPVKGRNYFTCMGAFYEYDPATGAVTMLYDDSSLHETGYIKYVKEHDCIYYLDEANLMRWKFSR